MSLFFSPTKALKKALYKGEGEPVDWELVEKLIQKGADPNVSDDYSYTPLMAVLEKGGPLHLCKLLLEKGADAKQKTPLHTTVFHYAAHRGDVETCRLLIQYGARFNQSNCDSENALSYAIQGRKAQVCEFLLNLGAEIKKDAIRNAFSNHSCLPICELLLQKGVSTEFKDEFGRSLLFQALRFKQLELAHLLLKYEAEVNTQDMFGFTPLMEVTQITAKGSAPGAKPYTVTEQLEMLQLLLSYGADLNMKNEQGQTAEDIAEMLEVIDIQGFFKSIREKEALKQSLPEVELGEGVLSGKRGLRL